MQCTAQQKWAGGGLDKLRCGCGWLQWAVVQASRAPVSARVRAPSRDTLLFTTSLSFLMLPLGTCRIACAHGGTGAADRTQLPACAQHTELGHAAREGNPWASAVDGMRKAEPTDCDRHRFSCGHRHLRGKHSSATTRPRKRRSGQASRQTLVTQWTGVRPSLPRGIRMRGAQTRARRGQKAKEVIGACSCPRTWQSTAIWSPL
jgi:hypothetical protein